jgi:hypothetical protein
MKELLDSFVYEGNRRPALFRVLSEDTAAEWKTGKAGVDGLSDS